MTSSVQTEEHNQPGLHAELAVEYLMSRRNSLSLGAKAFAVPEVDIFGSDDYGGWVYGLDLKYRF